MSKHKIIIDTDPGQDDAVAILFAFAHPDIEVLGLTCVAGNVPLSLTEQNARRLCDLAHADVPVFAGCDKPLERPLITAEHVHGKTGMDGYDWGAPRHPLQTKHAVDFLIETFRNAPAKSITLCTLGPLTNVATALVRAPDIADRIKDIVIMGGSHFEGGNITPVAEFNFYVDPHAADIVMKSDTPKVIHSLDVTHKALVTQKRLDHFAALGNAAGTAIAGMLGHNERFDLKQDPNAGIALHDPCVLAYVVRPDLFSGKFINVTMETQSELGMGMSVADWWGVTDRPANATFIQTIDHEGFFDLLYTRLATL